MNTSIESNRALDRIISSMGDLPASPAIVSTLMSQTTDSGADLDKICDTLMADQSLTARLLKLSNSSFYGRAKEVATLREAVLILGFKTLRSLVLAASTHSLYKSSVESAITEKLWEHSLASAIASRYIAEEIGHSQIEEAFIAGLMHDIGKLVMIEKIHDEYLEIIETVENSQSKFVDEEKERLSFTHADVGLLLLNKWAFPPALANAVFEHHNPTGLNQTPTPLGVIVNLANFMGKNLSRGFDDFRMADPSVLPSAEALEINAARLSDIQIRTADRFEREQELYLVKT